MTLDTTRPDPHAPRPYWARWQRFVAGQGFAPGPADGAPGDRTAGATRAWQESQGLDPDGIVGPASAARAFELGLRLFGELTAEALALALCVATETNRADEMPYVAGVIKNRVRNHYRGKSVQEVVLARLQFSAFNGRKSQPRQALEQPTAVDMYRATQSLVLSGGRFSAELFQNAVTYSAHANPWLTGDVQDTHARLVHHYYSPDSMRPPGSAPDWATADREVIVSRIPANRFRWFWGVA